jgi:hypothetical protein
MFVNFLSLLSFVDDTTLLLPLAVLPTSVHKSLRNLISGASSFLTWAVNFWMERRCGLGYVKRDLSGRLLWLRLLLSY